MDRATALQLLPTAYATALRLQERGASHATIARELDVAIQAVPRLLELGASKLDAILACHNPIHGTAGLGDDINGVVRRV